MQSRIHAVIVGHSSIHDCGLEIVGEGLLNGVVFSGDIAGHNCGPSIIVAAVCMAIGKLRQSPKTEREKH